MIPLLRTTKAIIRKKSPHRFKKSRHKYDFHTIQRKYIHCHKRRVLKSCKYLSSYLHKVHHPVSMLRSSHRLTASTAIESDTKDPDIMYEYESRQLNEDTADAKVIFELIFGEISTKMGGDSNMVFPKDIMWLCGAPGSGKGEMSQWIMYQRGYHAEPIRISAILNGAEIEELKARGKLVSDRIVLTILLEKLLLPEYRTGVIVDGFPRTTLQAECIKLLFDKMLQFRRRFDGTKHFIRFRRPKFHITVLYVDKAISIQRQLNRGKSIEENNALVAKTGVGELIPIRQTDVDSEKALERYQYFHDHIYQSIRSMKGKFPFHFISAEAPIEIVKDRILKELEYQSANELGDETFDMVRQMSLASEIKLDARHKLVTRLDLYATQQYKKLFQQVINVFKYEFEPLVRQQALMGTCIVSSESDIFEIEDGIGLAMMLDLLAERGYRAILDVLKTEKPVRIDPVNGEMEYQTRKIYKFHIHFPPPKMRHAIHTYDTDVSVLQ